MHQNNLFYFLKINFNIITPKRFEKKIKQRKNKNK